MSSNVNAIIKLRTDTIENWVIHNPVIHKNEQIVVKLSDGKIGYKLGTGVEFNSTPYVSYESITTDTINHGNAVLSLPNESGTLATLLPLYSYLQVIKPECTFYSHIHVAVSDSQDFSRVLFELDSNISPNLFKALSNGKWFNIGSGGFGIEYNNCPILINLRTKLVESKYNLTSSTILYINYYWYYNNEDDESVKSDLYSSILPSNTEVGANSQNTVSKSELNSLVYGCNIPATNVEGLDEYLEEHGVSGTITDQDIVARSLSLNGDLIVGGSTENPMTAISTKPGYTIMRLKDSSNNSYYHLYLENGVLTSAKESDSSAGDLSDVVDESSTSIITSVLGYSVIKWKDKVDGTYYFMTLHDGDISISHTLPDIANSESQLINELNQQVIELKSKVDKYEAVIDSIRSLDNPSQSISSVQSSIISILDAFKNL